MLLKAPSAMLPLGEGEGASMTAQSRRIYVNPQEVD